MCSCNFDLYHNGKHILCLCKNPNLSNEDLDFIFDCCLKKNITIMDLSNQKNLNDDHLKKLAHSCRSLRIKSLNLKNTNVGYNGILEIWKSKVFGSIREEDPVYYRWYSKPVSIIEIDIDNTKLIEQYKEKEKVIKNFPFPLQDDFEISYISPYGKYVGKELNGIKEVILKVDGKEIK